MSEQLIIAILGSSSIASIVTAIVNAIISNSKRFKKIENADKVLLKDRLKHLGKAYIDRGSITTDELEDFHEMYECYRELDGNGFLEQFSTSVNRLPINNTI